MRYLDGFRHEALLYAGDADFMRRVHPFIREGIARDEPAMVVVGNGEAPPGQGGS